MSGRRAVTAIASFAIFLILGIGNAGATGARLFKSGPIQITADGRRVWVANVENGSVSLLETYTEEVTEAVLAPVVVGARD